MRIKLETYELELTDDKTYTPNSTDNLRSYDREIYLPEKYAVQTQHGIVCFLSDGGQRSCIILANGFSTIHDHSAIILSNKLFIAIGKYLCCLKLPLLELEWNLELDFSSIFGIYLLQQSTDIITHGEVSISRVTNNGKLIWSCSGKDIFSEGFRLAPNGIEAIDFNHEKYLINPENGEMKLLNG